MVAINQLDNLAAATADAAGTAETVPVDSTKLANADAIVLKSGDSKGSPVAIQAVALQAAPAGPTVTFKNGSETFATLAAADGKVVLPDVSTNAPTFTAENCYKDVNFTFYGWVDENGADITADTAVTENMTVYAKFDTGHILGDINGDAKINVRDYTALKKYIQSKTTPKENEFVGSAIYKGYDKLIGDINTDSKINVRDYTALKKYIQSKTTPKENAFVGEKVYFVNKVSE